MSTAFKAASSNRVQHLPKGDQRKPWVLNHYGSTPTLLKRDLHIFSPDNAKNRSFEIVYLVKNHGGRKLSNVRELMHDRDLWHSQPILGLLYQKEKKKKKKHHQLIFAFLLSFNQLIFFLSSLQQNNTNCALEVLSFWLGIFLLGNEPRVIGLFHSPSQGWSIVVRVGYLAHSVARSW